MNRPALELRAATRYFGTARALAPTSLVLHPGSVALVEGGNGAGKSTLLRVAAGVLRPSAGTRTCAGRALYLRPDGGGRAAERVRDAVGFTAAACDSPGVDVGRSLEAVGLAELGGRRVGSLSTGQRARLMLAHLLVSAPAVACLDEPTAHLDPEGAQRVVEALRDVLAAGTAVLVATHAPAPFLALQPARLVLDAGRVTVRDQARALLAETP